MVGGAVISSFFAIVFNYAFENTSLTWLAGALSVATSIAVMDITGALPSHARIERE